MSGHCNECGNTICVCKVEDDIQFKSVQDLTRELQDKLASQQKIIEELKKGLEFYALGFFVDNDYSEVVSKTNFHFTGLSRKNSGNGEFETAEKRLGNLARETLKKVKEMEG